jgi:hypothetical protein
MKLENGLLHKPLHVRVLSCPTFLSPQPHNVSHNYIIA